MVEKYDDSQFWSSAQLEKPERANKEIVRTIPAASPPAIAAIETDGAVASGDVEEMPVGPM